MFFLKKKSEVSNQSRVETNRIFQGIEQIKKILNTQKPNAKAFLESISDREKSKTMKFFFFFWIKSENQLNIIF